MRSACLCLRRGGHAVSGERHDGYFDHTKVRRPNLWDRAATPAPFHARWRDIRVFGHVGLIQTDRGEVQELLEGQGGFAPTAGPEGPTGDDSRTCAHLRSGRAALRSAGISDSAQTGCVSVRVEIRSQCETGGESISLGLRCCGRLHLILIRQKRRPD